MLETLTSQSAKGNLERHQRQRVSPSLSHSDKCVFEFIDHVPPIIPNRSHSAQLYLFEDNAKDEAQTHGTSQERTESIWLACLGE